MFLIWEFKQQITNGAFLVEALLAGVVAFILNISSHYDRCEKCNIFMKAAIDSLRKSVGHIKVTWRYSYMTDTTFAVKDDPNDKRI